MMNFGIIELEKLEVDCIVGILPFERVKEQKVFLDVSMEIDFQVPASTEQVEDTIDYTFISQELTDLVKTSRYQLIETMAVECADLILDRHPLVQRVSVAVHKPAAVPMAKDTVVKYGKHR